MMPNGDPRDGFFYPTLTLMIDSSTVLCPFLVMSCLLSVIMAFPGQTRLLFLILEPFRRERKTNYGKHMICIELTWLGM